MYEFDYPLYNSHWKFPYSTKFKFKRDIYQRIIDNNKLQLMTFIIGPRRMGKSVILTQIIDKLINEERIEPTNILSWECKKNQNTDFLEALIKNYLNSIANKKNRIYIIIDEIQFIFDWENTIKIYYDQNPNIKFIITGSVSLSYKRKMEESLAGRFLPFDVYPLNFTEYLRITDNQFLLNAVQNKTKNDITLPVDLINKEFVAFLQKGRYPEAITFDDYSFNNYLQSIVFQSLNQDSMTYFDVERTDILFDIFKYLRLNNGSEVVNTTLSQIVGASIITVKKYIDVLELLGLIYIVNNSINPLKRNTSSKKIYVSTAFDDSNLIYNPEKIGMLVESYIYERISVANFGRFSDLGYYRERNFEIDFVNYKDYIGYEVKFRNKIEKKEIEKFVLLCNKRKLKPFLITKDTLESNIEIDYQLAILF